MYDKRPSVKSSLWAVTPALHRSAFNLGSAARAFAAQVPERARRVREDVLLALEATETALVTYRQRPECLVELTDEVRESTRAANIAAHALPRERTDLLSLLDAERTALGLKTRPRRSRSNRMRVTCAAGTSQARAMRWRSESASR